MKITKIPIPAPKDNPPFGRITTNGIPKRTIIKFVNAKETLNKRSTSHLVVSTPFSLSCLIIAILGSYLLTKIFGSRSSKFFGFSLALFGAE